MPPPPFNPYNCCNYNYTPYRYESKSEKRWVVYGYDEYRQTWAYLTEAAYGATECDALRDSGYGECKDYTRFNVHPYDTSVRLTANDKPEDRVSRMTQSKL